MTDVKTMLCVGGPMGGKRYAVQSGNGFRVSTIDRSKFLSPTHPDYAPNAIAHAVNQLYHEAVFHTETGTISFWVPDGQKPSETMKLLIDGYERSMLAAKDTS
jgi:hypothetical protein